MRELFGLPAHPLLVHAPVVLMPLLLVAVAAIAVRGSWRERFRWWVVGFAAVVLASIFLVADSGEELADELVDQGIIADSTIAKHADLGEATRLWVLVLVVVLVAMGAFDRWRSREQAPSWAPAVSVVLRAGAVVFAVLSMVWMARAGHEGARVVWDGVLE